jgi:O-antigen/teichoic acid export membrane protein
MLLVLIPRELGYALAQAHGKFKTSFALEATYFIGSLAAFGALFTLNRLNDAETALAVNLICAAASSLIALLAFSQRRKPTVSGDWKGVIRYGRWIGVLGLSEVYLQQGDALLIGAFVTPAQIAPYLAARTLLRLYSLFSQSINFVVLPVASRLAAAGQLDRLRRRLAVTFRSLFFVLLPANAILWLWSPTLFPLFLGDRYVSAIPIFRVLIFATFLEPVYSIYGNAVAGIGRPDAVAKAVPAAIIFNVTANLILLPRIGLPAAPFVLVATYAILVIQLLRVSARTLRAGVAI